MSEKDGFGTTAAPPSYDSSIGVQPGFSYPPQNVAIAQPPYQGGYPPQQPGYPPQQPGYPPQQPGYPPQQPGYGADYPPQQASYPPPQQYPPAASYPAPPVGNVPVIIASQPNTNCNACNRMGMYHGGMYHSGCTQFMNRRAALYVFGTTAAISLLSIIIIAVSFDSFTRIPIIMFGVFIFLVSLMFLCPVAVSRLRYPHTCAQYR